MVLPAPLAHSAHPCPSPHPHHTYPGGQALLAVQADSTLISDLREVFILKFLKADVMGEPGGSGDGRVTQWPSGGQEGAGCRGACGLGAALTPWERLSQSLLGRKTGNAALSREDRSVPIEWLGLAWSMAVGRQEECVPKQSLPDQRQQRPADWENMYWTAQPALSLEVCSAHTIPGSLWDCPSWAQTLNRVKAGITGRGKAGGPDRAQLEDAPAGTGDHIETHRTCKPCKPLSHGTVPELQLEGMTQPCCLQ